MGIQSALGEVANDTGSGAYTNISVARPAVDEAMVSAAHVGHYSRAERRFLNEGDAAPTSWLFVNGSGTALDGKPALQAVGDMTTVWSKPGYVFYHPIAAEPYVVVGDVFETQEDAAEAEKAHYALVHQEFCEQIPYGDAVWQDKGSGTATDGSAWSIGSAVPIAGDAGDPAAVLFRATDSYEKPEGMAWKIKDGAWVEVQNIWIGK